MKPINFRIFAQRLKDCPQLSIQDDLNKIPHNSWVLIDKEIMLALSQQIAFTNGEMWNSSSQFIREETS